MEKERVERDDEACPYNKQEVDAQTLPPKRVAV